MVQLRFLLPTVLFATTVWTQTIAPIGIANRQKPADYPVHGSSPEAAIGAEYLLHSFTGTRGTYIARDHLVVEIGVFPSKELMVSSGHFTLKVNGKKQTLFAQPPQFVAAGLKWEDWEHRPRMDVFAGSGDATIGASPRWEPRFPGDTRQRRLPEPPKAPQTEYESAGRTDNPEKAEEVVIQTALVEGPTALPIAGYLYFPFKGKPKSIRSLELIYTGPSGSGGITLKLI
jgi:hypothetical protein